ncbi:MAG: hypothetical protein V3U75_11575 [Methylococcaceae bacterium]
MCIKSENVGENLAEIKQKLLLTRKRTGLEIIANIAAQTGEYSHINNVDLKLELIQNAIRVIHNKT